MSAWLASLATPSSCAARERIRAALGRGEKRTGEPQARSAQRDARGTS
jgi:hypothetical protein